MKVYLIYLYATDDAYRAFSTKQLAEHWITLQNSRNPDIDFRIDEVDLDDMSKNDWYENPEGIG